MEQAVIDLVLTRGRPPTGDLRPVLVVVAVHAGKIGTLCAARQAARVAAAAVGAS